MIEHIRIAYQEEALSEKAQNLAQKLGLLIDNEAESQLLLTPTQLVLKMKGFSPMGADFSSKTWQKRRDEGKKQAIVRALKPRVGLRILDATAGWGRDAAILASFGAEVLMLERQPIMFALLEDALARQDEHSKKILQLSLRHCDAMSYLQFLGPDDYPDAIYLDPMHPLRQKKALVKKDLQALQNLFGPDEDAINLLELARKKVLQRVVVKWPQQSKPLLPPSYSIPGKVIRFDVYLPSAVKQSVSE